MRNLYLRGILSSSTVRTTITKPKPLHPHQVQLGGPPDPVAGVALRGGHPGGLGHLGHRRPRRRHPRRPQRLHPEEQGLNSIHFRILMKIVN